MTTTSFVSTLPVSTLPVSTLQCLMGQSLQEKITTRAVNAVINQQSKRMKEQQVNNAHNMMLLIKEHKRKQLQRERKLNALRNIQVCEYTKRLTQNEQKIQSKQAAKQRAQTLTSILAPTNRALPLCASTGIEAVALHHGNNKTVKRLQSKHAYSDKGIYNASCPFETKTLP